MHVCFKIIKHLCLILLFFYLSLQVLPIIASPSYEDFLTYVEVDPNSHISIPSSTHIDHIAERDEDAYVYKDYGSGFFTDFSHLIDIKSDFQTSSGLSITWSLQNDIDDMKGIWDNSQTSLSVWFRRYAGYKISLRESYAGGVYDDSYNGAINTWYYLTITKTGTSLTCKIYSDISRTNLLDTLTLTLQADHNFQYVFGCNTYNDGNTVHYMNNDVENLDLLIVPPVYKTFDLMVLFLNETRVSNANVSMIDNNDNTLFNVQTNSSGQIASQNHSYPNNPHTLRIFKKGIRTYLSVFNVTTNSSFIITVQHRQWDTSTEGITFLPNSIPELYFEHINYTFVFTYRKWHLTLKPFVIYDNESYTLKKILPFMRKYGIEYSHSFHKMKDSIKYGFNITNIPQWIGEKLQNLGFKIVDYNFALKHIQLIQSNASFELYIPKFHFGLAFGDLFNQGFTLQFLNKTFILIGKVTNKTNLNLDPIVYSSNVIQVTGFSEGSEANLQDICDINDEEGWSQVDAIGKDAVILDAKLQIGDSYGNETWFADENKQLIMSENVSSGKSIRIMANGHFRSGVIINESKNVTYGGCMLISDSPISIGDHSFIYVEINGSLNLYSSVIAFSKTIGYNGLIRGGGNITICNSILSNGIGIIYEQQNLKIFNVQISTTSSKEAIQLLKDDLTIDAIQVMNCQQAFKTASTWSFTLRDISVRNCSRLGECSGWGGEGYIIDANIDDWTILFIGASGEVYEQYSLYLQVVFPNGTHVQNANVSISYVGEGGGIIGSWLTNSTGQISPVILTKRHYNASGIYLHEPFRLNITWGDYWEYNSSFNLTNTSLNWIISLHDPKPKDYAFYLIGFLIIASVCGLVIYLGLRKKRSE